MTSCVAESSVLAGRGKWLMNCQCLLRRQTSLSQSSPGRRGGLKSPRDIREHRWENTWRGNNTVSINTYTNIRQQSGHLSVQMENIYLV